MVTGTVAAEGGRGRGRTNRCEQRGPGSVNERRSKRHEGRWVSRRRGWRYSRDVYITRPEASVSDTLSSGRERGTQWKEVSWILVNYINDDGTYSGLEQDKTKGNKRIKKVEVMDRILSSPGLPFITSEIPGMPRQVGWLETVTTHFVGACYVFVCACRLKVILK